MSLDGGKLAAAEFVNAHFTSLSTEAQAVIVALILANASVAIGSPVTDGDAQSVLFLDLLSQLSQDSDFTYDPALGLLANPRVFTNILTSPGNLIIQSAIGNETTLSAPGSAESVIVISGRVPVLFKIWSERAETLAAIGANQNDYVVSDNGAVKRLSASGAFNITGMTFDQGGIADRKVLLLNVGANNITLKHQDAASTAGLRFLCSTGADIVLAANQAADVWYDNVTAVWRVFKRN